MMFRLRLHPAEAPRLAALYGPAALPLAIAGAVLSAGTSILGGMQQQKAGAAQQQEADIEAKQLDQNAGQERAAAQQAAIQQRRQARLAQSRNQAVAAASGGGADDPTVLALDSSLAGEGEYNALTALYQGEAKARGMESDAEAARYQGRLAKFSGKQAFMGSLFSAGTSLLSGTGSALMLAYPAKATLLAPPSDPGSLMARYG